MTQIRECPKCGTFMQYEHAEPDVGITGGWFCPTCEFSELDDADEAPELTEEFFERADVYQGDKLVRAGRPRSENEEEDQSE